MTSPRPWTVLDTEEVHDCTVFRVFRDRVCSPLDGQAHPFWRLVAADWVNVVPVTEDDRVVMVRQWRHGARALTLEIPGGIVDPGESPAEAAARETLEETGYAGGELIPIGTLNPNPALFTNRVHTFWARGVARVAEIANHGHEETAVELVPLADLDRRVHAGEVDHALVIAALHWFALARLGSG
jgi:8-oxo-dGTP pyrophosphatase MutT (NUDIX family)